MYSEQTFGIYMISSLLPKFMKVFGPNLAANNAIFQLCEAWSIYIILEFS